MSTPLSAEAVRAKSPALRFFELNPFRCFRLPVTASATEAARVAETVLTLARLDLPPEEPDLIPWLEAPATFQLQQAAQSVEEPYVRLRAQLLWFDTERDPAVGELRAALRDPNGEAVSRYLAIAPPPSAANPDGAFDPAPVALALNQANLRLLMATALHNGVAAPAARAVAVSPGFPEKAWKPAGEFRVLLSPQKLLAGVAVAERGQAADDWQEALRAWEQHFGDPQFTRYVELCIAQLEDDLVTSDDVEAVRESVRTFLADLAGQEIRHLLLDGRYETATELLDAVAQSGMDQQKLRQAMRPLLQVFQGELVELEPLLEQAQSGELSVIDGLINRVAAVRERWTRIDRAGLLGLLDLLDEMVETIFQRARGVDIGTPKLAELAEKIAAIASAESLKVRVKSFLAEIAEAKKRFCHFCQSERPDYEKSFVLSGKKETHREYNTIYYSLRWAMVLRCKRCARLHDFMTSAAILQCALLMLLGLVVWIIIANS